MESYALGAFPKDGGVDKSIRSLKLVFGARHFDGYHAFSLKAVLNDILGVDRAAIFKTDRGSRFGTAAHNCRALILNKEAVLQALNQADTKEPKAAGLKSIMTSSWSEFALKLAVFALFWYCVAAPFHSAVSKPDACWAEIKCAIQETHEKLVTLSSTEIDPLEFFQMAVQREDVSDLTKQLLDRAVPLFKESSSNVSKTLSVKIAKVVVDKFQAKTKVLLNAGFSDEIILPWTNRAVEASFGHLKSVMLKFKNMTGDKFSELGKIRINRVVSWYNQLEPERRRALMTEAKSQAPANAIAERKRRSDTQQERVQRFLAKKK